MSPRQDHARNVAEVPSDSFGAQLRYYREQAGLTQGQLGEAIGLDQKRISTFELNRVIPREEIIVELAEALNVPPARFFEATRFKGVLPINPERRQRLQSVHERDWRLFDATLDTLGEITPEQRATFEQGFRDFLKRWRE